MARKKPPSKARFRIPTPPGTSTPRFVFGKLIGSMEHWWTVLLGIGAVIAVSRANVADLPVITQAIVTALEASSTVAWLVAVCVVLSAIVVIWFVTWRHGRELDRIAEERDKCQEQLLRKVRSSQGD